MASAEAEAIKQMIREWGAAQAVGADLTLEEIRANGETFGELAAEPEGVKWIEVSAGGIPALWAEPDSSAEDRVLLYVHGGGYVLGSLDSYRRFTGHLAKVIGCRVLSLGYGLAPENPHPGPVNDTVVAYRWLLSEGYRPEHLAIAGDSAGGGLTLATLLKLRDDGVAQPAAAVPMSPWADMEGLGETMRSNADKDLIVQSEGLAGMAGMFLSGGDPRDPLAAPIHGDYHGICPLYIQVGDDETLLDDSRRVAARAEADGVDVTLDVFPEMQHVFQLCAGNMPEADDAVGRIGAYLRPKLGLTSPL
jgi:monoterpene epsilon-lactone hydrolase